MRKLLVLSILLLAACERIKPAAPPAPAKPAAGEAKNLCVVCKGVGSTAGITGGIPIPCTGCGGTGRSQ